MRFTSAAASTTYKTTMTGFVPYSTGKALLGWTAANRFPSMKSIFGHIRRILAFSWHGTGRSWIDAGGDNGNYSMAIHYLTKSVELRDEDHAYPWLHLAAACAEAGKREEALEWLEKAEQEISTLPQPPDELIELRDETRKTVMNLTSSFPSGDSKSVLGPPPRE